MNKHLDKKVKEVLLNKVIGGTIAEEYRVWFKVREIYDLVYCKQIVNKK
ncbi:MAG: hypothetical protein QXI56_08220 [Candidatus Bathyarchaeia archaeon]